MANKRPVEKVDYNGGSNQYVANPSAVSGKQTKTAGGFVWRYKKGEN